MSAFRFPLMLGRSMAVACVLTLSLGACKPSAQQEANGPADAATTAASAAQDHAAAPVTHWRCGQLAVSTHFDDDSLESITLRVPDRTLTLKSMANEDGARFADAAGNEFWSRPGKVSLTQVGQATVACTKERG